MSTIETPEAETSGTSNLALRLFLWAGIVGPLFFVLVLLLDGWLTPGWRIHGVYSLLSGLFPLFAGLGNLYSSFVVENASHALVSATTSQPANGGLVNRIIIIVAFAWYVILASHMLLRESRGVKAPGG
jgi:hypothetical protein